jgi:GT2 family glycosyltransferase
MTNAIDLSHENDAKRAIVDWLKTFSYNLPVVVVPVFNAYEDVLECVNSLVACTDLSIPLLILDDASTDTRIASTLKQLSLSGRFAYIRKATNSGFVGTVNLAFEATSPHDVVLVNSDVIVPPAWLERLRDAVYCRTTIATATPLTNNGTLLSVPHRNTPISYLGPGMTAEQVDQRIRAISLRLRPIIPTAIGHCTYLKRAVLELVGYLDETFAPGYGE